jgi:prepilin-type N-terminal cleavage/methylation domain-containing protein
MREDPQRAEGGFTLVELLVVTLVIGILSAIALPTLAAQTGKAKKATLRATLRDAATAEYALAAETGSYAPPGDPGLALLAGQGYHVSPQVVVTVVDDDMSDAGHGFCLKAVAPTLAAGEELYYASTGAEAGHPTSTACVAS